MYSLQDKYGDTMSTTDDTDPRTTMSSPFLGGIAPSKYAIIHVFLPARLYDPVDGLDDVDVDAYYHEGDLSLARAVCAAAHAYSTHVYGTSEEDLWRRITKMLDDLQASAQSKRLDKHHTISQLRGMQIGGMITVVVEVHADNL